MVIEEEIIEIKKTLAILANQNVELQRDIINLIAHDTNQIRLITHQGEYLSSLNGQINLFLQFILSEPSSLLRFAAFAKNVASNTTDTHKEMKVVAQWLLDNGLQHYVSQPPEYVASPQAGSPPANTNQAGSPQLGANVIQFPKPPKNDDPQP